MAARLLLAEDEDTVLVTLTAVLQQEGYEVTPVHSAAEGFDALRSGSFDLIVTDMRMEHESSGLDLVAEARRMDPQAVAIVLTGYGSFPSAVEALQSGVFDYLTKPSNLDQLKASIARGLEKRQLDRAVLQAQRAEAARLVAEQHAREATLRADISAALAERGSLEDILNRCAEALVTHLQAAYARIWVLKPGEDVLELMGTAGTSTVSGPLRRTTIPMGAWLLGRAAAERRAIYSQDLPTDPLFSDRAWARREGMTCYASYPMVVEDRTIGAIALFARTMFSQETLDTMGPVAAAIGQGIERRRAEEQRNQLLVAERQARARAEAAERRLQQIVEALPEAILVVDPEGHPLLWNKATTAIIGPVGRDIDFTVLPAWRLDGTEYQRGERPLARAIRCGETVQERLLISSRTGGDKLPILANAAPIYDGEGRLLGGVSVFQDISSIRELEQQKTDFLSAAAHDLKTPLTAMKGLVQMLQRQLSSVPGLPEATAGTLAAADAATRKMAGLVDELLDVTRLEMQSELDLLIRPVDLLALVKGVVEDQRQAAERHELELRTELASLECALDRTRVERAVANLISNAIKFSPDGGEVLIEVSREEHGDGAWAVVAVTDHGVGIPASDLPRIFDRFRRAGNVRGRIAGTGIGLAYVHEIASQHGGEVQVRSQEGRGSTFVLRLPVGLS